MHLRNGQKQARVEMAHDKASHSVAASLLVKSRIGRWHASNLGLYFSHFRSDDKAPALYSVLAWKCTVLYLRSSKQLSSIFIHLCTVACK